MKKETPDVISLPKLGAARRKLVAKNNVIAPNNRRSPIDHDYARLNSTALYCEHFYDYTSFTDEMC